MRSTVRFSTLMLSCDDRAAARATTLASLGASGWSWPVEIVLDDGVGSTRIERIRRGWRRVIQRASTTDAEFILLLEDDVVFGRWFADNLASWPLLLEVQPGGAFFASLYNPGRPVVQRRKRERYAVAHARDVWGSQAIVTTPATARFIEANWDQAMGNPDQRMPRIASGVTPIYYHLPSLVDHAKVPTTWGGLQHSAVDFDPEWRAAPEE
jgi:hypothetical protein